MKNIYTYFDYQPEIIDATFIGTKNHELKQNFVKRWGRDLNGNSYYHYTEKDKRDFLKYKKIFIKNLEYAKSRYENGYSLEEITKSLRENKPLNLRLPVYENKKDLCNTLNINYKQLDSILEKIDLNEKLAFTYYIGLDRPKMYLGEISKLLNCEVEQIISFIIKTNSFIKKEARIIKKDNKVTKRGRRIIKNFYDFFEEKDRENVIAIIKAYQEMNHQYYQTLIKIYGENYDSRNPDIKLEKKDANNINNFKTKIKSYLKQIYHGISLEEIMNSLKTNSKESKIVENTKIKKCFLDSFEEQDRENVIAIIKAYQEINHQYYQTLIKIYGKNYDSRNPNIKLEKQEKNSINNFKIKIKQYLSTIQDGISLEEITNFIKMSSKKSKIIDKKKMKNKKCFLDSFEEQERENVIAIIKAYQEINHQYYQTLVKIYGENYDGRNPDIKLEKKDANSINNFKTKIKSYLKQIHNGMNMNEICSKITKEKVIPKETGEISISFTKQMPGEDLIILKSLYEQHLTVKEITNIFGISEEEIDFCLIRYLHLFKENIPTVLLEILKRNHYSTGKIINYSFLKRAMENLTELEKMYLYLKLDSYHNCSLDDKKIAKLLGLSIRDIKHYQILTQNDHLNTLNKLLIKK